MTSHTISRDHTLEAGSDLEHRLTSSFAGKKLDFEFGQFDDWLLLELERMKQVSALSRGQDENAAVGVENEPIHA